MSVPPQGAGSAKARKAPKEPFKPTEEAIAAIGTIVGLIEKLAPRDRGYVTARLKSIYDLGKAEAGEKAPKGKKPSEKKASYNEEWQKTPEFASMKELQDQVKKLHASKTEPPPELLEQLKTAQNVALSLKLKLRDELGKADPKTRANASGNGAGGPSAAPAPAEDIPMLVEPEAAAVGSGTGKRSHQSPGIGLRARRVD